MNEFNGGFVSVDDIVTKLDTCVQRCSFKRFLRHLNMKLFV